MGFFKYLFFFVLAAAISGLTFYLYFYQSATPPEQLFSVETPVRKEIKQEIDASGSLKLKGQVKIGSVVPGRVQAIHVEENDVVAEGQLLVEIDTGLEDTEVREAQGSTKELSPNWNIRKQIMGGKISCSRSSSFPELPCKRLCAVIKPRRLMSKP